MISWATFKNDMDSVHRRLDRIEELLSLILSRLDRNTGEEIAERHSPSPLVRSLLRTGHRLQAIKAYMEEASVSAQEAELALHALPNEKPRPACRPSSHLESAP